jgi:high-affinity iron transporter
MFQTLMVTFREGVEAFLIVAITLAYLRQTGRTHLVPALRWAAGIAVSGSVVLGIILARYGAMQPIHEAFLALAAFFLVLSCTWHMMRHGKRMASEIRGKIDAAGQSSYGAWLAVFSFVLFMIGREGVETATMLASLSQSQSTLHLALGGLLGVALAGALAFAWARYGKRINLTRFFQVTAIFMVIFSVQLLILAFHEFSEAGALPFVDNAYWHEATENLAQGTIGQMLSMVMVLAPMLFVAQAWWKDRNSLPMQAATK